MALKDIIGQDRAIALLRGCVAKQRIPHSLLFCGDEGIGKRLTAINFAKALNCVNTGEEDLFAPIVADDTDSAGHDHFDACNGCPSCLKIDQGNHPDVFTIGPEGDGGQITVSAIRQLEEALSYKPYEGKWKIALIDNAEKLNASAANAFLQTLEEPSAQSMLILISSRPEMLLPTIRSRCQRIHFSPIPAEAMSGLLQKQFGYSDRDQASLLSRISGGRLGLALDEDIINQRDWSFRTFRQMLDSVEGEIWDDKDAMEAWFEWSQLVLRDIAVYKATKRPALLINQDMADEIKSLSQNANLRDILNLFRELYNIRRKLPFNLNRQLTLNYTSLLLKKYLGQGRG